MGCRQPPPQGPKQYMTDYKGSDSAIPGCAERRESPKVAERRVVEAKKISHKTKNTRIFEEELKARIGYEILEPFECCNTCRSRAGELCNKWYPNTFKHGAFEAKCKYYNRGGS